MPRSTVKQVLLLVLLTFFVTASVSAQVRFAGSHNTLKVNDRMLESSDVPKSLSKTIEEYFLTPVPGPRCFTTYDSTSPFPLRVNINGVSYDIWAEHITKSCGIGKPTVKILMGEDWLSIGPYGRMRRRTQNKPTIQVNSFKEDGQKIKLFVNYGIPMESLYDHEGETIELNTYVKTSILDDQYEVIFESQEKIEDLIPSQIITFPDRQQWVGINQTQVSTDIDKLSVELEVSHGKTTSLQEKVVLPGYNQTGVMLSDIMLAYSVEQTENGTPLSEHEIVRQDFSILPAARNTYLTNWPIYLYFEVYGLSLNAQGETSFEVEIKLEPQNTRRGIPRIFKRNKGKKGVSISYNGSGSEIEESLYQILDISDEKTGPYRLTVVVRDNETGEESKRSQNLFLEKDPCAE